MRIYTNIKDWPDTELENLCLAAAKQAKLRSRNVCVVIRASERRYGKAVKCYRSKYKSYFGDRRWHNTDGGYIVVWTGNRRGYRPDTLRYTENFFSTLVHEFAHVRDYQLYDRGKPQRFDFRPRWANRPHERRAIVAEKAAKERESEYADAVIEFALALENEREK